MLKELKSLNWVACPRHSLERFDWHNNELVAEASCLPGPLFSRLYADSIDEGFEIASPSGRVLKFYLERVDRDSTGEDILAWYFKPVAAIGTVSQVTVFND